MPGRQRACDAIAQHARITAEEIDLVANMQRQCIARVGDADVLEHAPRGTPAAFDEQPHRFHVPELALGACQRCRGCTARARDRQRRRLGAEQEQITLQHMRHRHLWGRRQRGVDCGDGVADIAAGLMRGRFQVRQAIGRGAGHQVAGRVVVFHLNFLSESQ